MFNGIWGMLRKAGVLDSDDGGAFVCSIWFGWFVQLVLQIMVQPSILPGAIGARAPPELAAFAFGMNFMPAYLDSKANSMPAEIDREYYGLDPLEQPSETNGETEEGALTFNNKSSRWETVEEC